MTVDVVTEITIDRPAAEVAAFATDPDNAPEWYDNIESVAWRTDPLFGIGSKVDFVARFLGRRLEYTYECVELDRDRRVVMRTDQGPFAMETTYEWTPAPAGGTRMTLRNRGEPTGFSRALAPLMTPAMRRANRKDLQKLKRLLEADR